MARNVQFYVDHTSPTIRYSPLDIAAGWTPHFSSSHLRGGSGNSTSYHATSRNNASVSVAFNGTGVQIFGNATNAAFNVTLDGAHAQFNDLGTGNDNILASFQDLTLGDHTISLTLLTPLYQEEVSVISFDKALITAPPPNRPINSTFSLQKIDDANIAFTGEWSINHTISDTPVHRTTTLGDHAEVNFTGTACLLSGVTSPNSGRYTVTFNNITTKFSARTSFTNQDSLLFFASGLDPDTTYKVKISNDGDGDLSLHGFKVFTTIENTPVLSMAPSDLITSNSRSLSKGAIAGISLGGAVALGVFLGLVFFCFVHRHRKRRFEHQRSATEHGIENVLDIAPNSNSRWAPRHSNLSWISGFGRWRTDIEYARSDLRDLGIVFRHSGSLNEKSSEESDGTDEDSINGDSVEASLNTSSSGRGNRRNKNSDRSHSSWLPTVTFALPSLSRHSNSDVHSVGSRSHSSRARRSAISAAQPSSTSAAGNRLTLPSSYTTYSNGAHTWSSNLKAKRAETPLHSVPPPVPPLSLLPSGAKAPINSRNALLRYGALNSQSPDEENHYELRLLTSGLLGSPVFQSPDMINGPSVVNESKISRENPSGVAAGISGGRRRSTDSHVSPKGPRPQRNRTRTASRDSANLPIVRESTSFTADSGAGPSRQRDDSFGGGYTVTINPPPDIVQGGSKVDKGKGRAVDESGGSHYPPPELRSTFRLTPPSIPPTPSRKDLTSFLDLSGSSNPSTRSHSVTTSSHSSKGVRNSAFSVPGQQAQAAWDELMFLGLQQPQDMDPSLSFDAGTKVHDRKSKSSSYQSPISDHHSSPSSIFPFPFPVALPSTASHAPQSNDASTNLSTSHSSQPLHVHPHVTDMLSVDSPTDSLPVSISDLFIRNTDSDYEIDTHHRSSSYQIPPHPPLPSSR